VDEVIRDLDSPRRTLEAAGVADVADVELVAGPLQTGCPRAIADKAADRRVRALEGRREPGADEAGCARDQDVRCDYPTLPGAGSRQSSPARLGCEA
jgi:hypothetical protein